MGFVRRRLICNSFSFFLFDVEGASRKIEKTSLLLLDHLSEFHAWLQQKRNQNLSFLLWVRTLISDETIVGMKWDDFVGKPRPNRAGKKLDAFNALFQVFSKEKSQMSMGTMVAAQAEKEEEEGRGRSRRSR